MVYWQYNMYLNVTICNNLILIYVVIHYCKVFLCCLLIEIVFNFEMFFNILILNTIESPKWETALSQLWYRPFVKFGKSQNLIGQGIQWIRVHDWGRQSWVMGSYRMGSCLKKILESSLFMDSVGKRIDHKTTRPLRDRSERTMELRRALQGVKYSSSHTITSHGRVRFSVKTSKSAD